MNNRISFIIAYYNTTYMYFLLYFDTSDFLSKHPIVPSSTTYCSQCPCIEKTKPLLFPKYRKANPKIFKLIIHNPTLKRTPTRQSAESSPITNLKLMDTKKLVSDS